MYNNYMDFLKKLFTKTKEKSHSGSSAFQNIFGSNSRRVSRQNLLDNNKNWVYTSVDKIANSISGVRFRLYRLDSNGDREEVVEHDVLDFINNINKQMTFRDFVYTHIAVKEIVGNVFWLRKEVDGVGEQLILIDPTKIEVKVVDDEIVGFKLNGMKPKFIPADEVFHDMYPSPDSQFVGTGTLERVAEWIDTDAFATEFNRTFFQKGAMIGGFLETEEESEERVKLIKLGINQEHVGIGNAHKIGILPKNTKWKPAGVSMRDMQFSELDNRYRDKIISAFGVPKSVLGIVDDVNRASAEASEFVYAKYTIDPKVKQFIEFLNEKLLRQFDDSSDLFFDFDDVVPQNRKEKREDNKVGLNNQPYLSINEVRQSEGLAPISGGDAVMGVPFLEPVGTVEKQAPKPQQRVRSRTIKERGKSKMFDAIDKGIDTLVEDFEEIAKTEHRSILEKKHKKFVGRTTEFEKKLFQLMQEFNLKQKNEVLRNLKQAVKAVKRADLFDEDTEITAMIDFAEPLLKLLSAEQISAEWVAQSFAGTPDTDPQRMKTFIERSTKKMAKSYNSTTIDLLTNKLNEGIANGESLVQLTKRVEQIYDFSDKVRARQVARSETFYASNASSQEAYRQSGVVKTIEWFTAEDEKVCQWCGPLDGKTFGVDERIFKKGAQYEGSDGGNLDLSYRSILHPPLHPSCRCFIQPSEISIKD